MTPRTRFRLGLALVGMTVVALCIWIVRDFGPGFAGGIAVGVLLSICLLVLGMRLLLLRAGGGALEDRLEPAKPSAPRPWDYAMALRDLDGGELQATAFRGRVLFQFWRFRPKRSVWKGVTFRWLRLGPNRAKTLRPD